MTTHRIRDLPFIQQGFKDNNQWFSALDQKLSDSKRDKTSITDNEAVLLNQKGE